MVELPVIILIVGVLVSLSTLIRAFFYQWHLAPIAAFIILGWFLRLSQEWWHFIPHGGEEIIRFLGDIGIIVILFHVGLDSYLKELIGQFSRASVLALSNMVLCAVLGFAVSFYGFGIELVPSLFISVALTATSIGVVIILWKEEGVLQTKTGQLLIDLTAIDDIIAIFLMAVLLKLAPFLGSAEGVTSAFYIAMGYFFLKIGLFIVGCYLFSHFIEPLLIRSVCRWERAPDPIVTVLCVGMVIAGIAGLLDFSIALGAFFAGLAFSRDPRALKMEALMEPLEAFFAPLFFINIGFQVFPGALSEAATLGVALIAVAIIGKVVGVMIPARWENISYNKAKLLGLSMIPRAEISLVVITHGLYLGAVSKHIYASIVMVSFVTCLITPIILKYKLIKKSGNNQINA